MGKMEEFEKKGGNMGNKQLNLDPREINNNKHKQVCSNFGSPALKNNKKQ